MKVLIINGSPRQDGNTSLALGEMVRVFESEGVEIDRFDLGKQVVRGCVGCGGCGMVGKCVFDDAVNDLAVRFEQADGLVVGSPVYYASPNGSLVSLLDRLFYSTQFDKTMKVGAAVACARRGGLTATWDDLNKYFGISGMPIAAGQYWNGVHGAAPGQAEGDAEGLQQMRTLARNMVFLMKSIALGREQFGLPEREQGIFTNFIR